MTNTRPTPTRHSEDNVESIGTFEHIGGIIERMAWTNKAFLNERSREAIARGLSLSEADEAVIQAFADQYWNRSYLLAELLTGAPVWPCGHELEALLDIARKAMTETVGIHHLNYAAAERCLRRMIEERARL